LSKIKKLIDEIATFLLDMDGVLYVGNTPIEGAAKTVLHLRKKDKKIIFVTNNSTNTRHEYVQKLAKMGIAARVSDVFTAGYVARLYLRERAPRARVLVVGGLGLKKEIINGGFKVLTDRRAEEADFVVVGLDRAINYEKLTAGVRALLAGAELIAMNMDATYPTEGGLCPGAGAFVGALSASSGKQPKVVIGKPSPFMIKLALDMVGSRPSKTAIVGDKLSTDILAGKRFGLKTILVLSGVTSKRDIKKIEAEEMPDLVIPSIKSLMVGK
jgi:HAD superfamily hydrolase (TIGR01457 family)